MHLKDSYTRAAILRNREDLHGEEEEIIRFEVHRVAWGGGKGVSSRKVAIAICMDEYRG